MEYDNTNKGVLFINTKATTDKHPSRQGSINIEGVEYWLSAWDKETSKGATISLSVERKDKPKEQPKKDYQAPSFADDLDDTIPF